MAFINSEKAAISGTCGELGCDRKIKARGLCSRHYRLAWELGPISTSVATHYYRYDLLDWRRRVLKLSVAKVARQLKLRERTIQDVLDGKASARSAYPVAMLLGLDWAQVHNLELQETNFYTAVSNGTGHAETKKESSFSFFQWLKRNF